MRRSLYRAARTLGDVKAVTSGRIAQRAANKAMGRAYGRATGGGCLLPVVLLVAGCSSAVFKGGSLTWFELLTSELAIWLYIMGIVGLLWWWASRKSRKDNK